MLSLNCPVEFDSNFWVGFDEGIKEEWNFETITSCEEVSGFPGNLDSYDSLAEELVSETTNKMLESYSNNFTGYLDFLLSTQNKKQQVVFLTEYSEAVFKEPLASGVAYPSKDLAFVENNFEYSTAALSHEILHLVLEEQGHEKSCYVDGVHENQNLYSIKEISDSITRFSIIQRFDC